jgi:hypothetical protein
MGVASQQIHDAVVGLIGSMSALTATSALLPVLARSASDLSNSTPNRRVLHGGLKFETAVSLNSHSFCRRNLQIFNSNWHIAMPFMTV